MDFEEWITQELARPFAGIADSRCRALTRAGKPCRNWAEIEGKCRRHYHRDMTADFDAWESELVNA